MVYASLWDVHVLPRLGSLALRELTPAVVNRFRLELDADGVGVVTVAKSLSLLQGVPPGLRVGPAGVQSGALDAQAEGGREARGGPDRPGD